MALSVRSKDRGDYNALNNLSSANCNCCEGENSKRRTLTEVTQKVLSGCKAVAFFIACLRHFRLVQFTCRGLLKKNLLETCYRLALFPPQNVDNPYPWPLFSSYPPPKDYLPGEQHAKITAFEEGKGYQPIVLLFLMN